MAAAFVQATASTEGSNVSTQNVTFGSTTTSGNCVVACTSFFDTDGTPPTTSSCADNKGNSANYQSARAQTYGSGRIQQFFCPNITGGATHQVTVTFGDSVLATTGILELSGVDTSASPTGGVNSATGTGTAVSSGSVTPTADGIFVAQMSYENLSRTISVNWSGATQRLEIDEDDSSSANNIATKAATNGAADTAGWTLSGSADWAGILVAYKAAAGGTTFTQSVSGGVTPAGAIAKQAQKAPAGSVASAGNMLKRTARALTGAIASAGALAAIKTALRSLAGTLTSAGSLSKRAGKVAAGAVASTGSLSKQPRRALTGAVTSAGTLASLKTALKALTGTIASSGALVRSTSKALSGALQPAGSVAKRIARALAGSLGAAGTITTGSPAAPITPSRFRSLLIRKIERVALVVKNGRDLLVKTKARR